jgi:hypothetical protein
MGKFDPNAIQAQIDNLSAERDQIDQAIVALQGALRNMAGHKQRELRLSEPGSEDVTLHDAVKQACMNMVDGITRQRVINAIEGMYPFLKPKSPSVAASLINLTKGDQPMLTIAIEGTGRSPSYYSTEQETIHHLSQDEARDLLDETTTHGTGGWQSLFSSLQKNFDKTNGAIKLTAQQRGRIYKYYRLGGGGWQDRVKRIFRRELPRLF